MGVLSLITAPSAEPIALDEVKRHLRVDVDDDDDEINDDISVAREQVELETGRQLLTATWELWLDTVPGQTIGADTSGNANWQGFTAYSLDYNFWWNRAFIDVPCAPLQSVVSIKYTDTSGVLQTWDPTLYQVSAPTGPVAARGRIRPAYGQSWPVMRDQMNALVVRFIAGYGATGTAVPARLRRAIKLIAGDLYENREATVVTDRRVTIEELPNGVAQILQQYRARPVMRAA